MLKRKNKLYTTLKLRVQFQNRRTEINLEKIPVNTNAAMASARLGISAFNKGDFPHGLIF